MRVTPFRFEVPGSVLEDLERRLRATRWPDAVQGAGWAYGTDPEYLRSLVEYWAEEFDWRTRERLLSAFGHYRAEVGGTGIHFIHERGVGPEPLPLVVTHGWPASFAEMVDLIPRLADPARYGGDAGDAFDVIVPSLPGYGFSDRPTSPGMTNRRIAGLWAELMAGLGYARFGAQGGDWGAGVSTWLGLLHPERLLGLHLNYIPGSYAPHLDGSSPPLTEAEKAFLAERERWMAEEGAYALLQGTRPQTVAFALNDSPAGLAAWIVEKFRAWADCEGEVERRIPRDVLLTNLTIYWATGTIGSSMRLYYESRSTPLRLGPGERVRVPTAVAAFPKEAPAPPREWVERGYDLVRWTEMPSGGHFAALEEPDFLAADIRAFFRAFR